MSNEKYHVLALGGIGMSAIARLLKQKGYLVSGYDDSLSDLTNKLQDEGVSVVSKIPDETKYLVYSSAISSAHSELLKAKNQNIKIIHRSDVLSKLMQGKDSVLVTGTHGKTTVSALLSHALEYAKLDPCFAVGGILNNYKTNAKWGSGDFFVSEADESDGSFLKHPGKYAIVTNIDNDHLDYWKTSKNLLNAFQKFLAKPFDKLIWCFDDENLRNMSLKGISFGFSKDADVKVFNYRAIKNGSVFSVQYLNKNYENIFIPLFGKHQVLNATAVLTFFLSCKLDVAALLKSFMDFKGVKRRQELIGSHNNVDLYTDYAHHPTEIRATLESFRKKIEERRLVVVFQPHRYSRVSFLINEFKNCFNQADSLYVTEIYSANESPQSIEKDLLSSIEHHEKHLLCADNFHDKLLKDVAMHDCVLFLGAGDINQKAVHFVDEFKQTTQKLKVGILYGGSKPEHEVSLKSAKFFFDNIDNKSYDIKPCFIEKNFEINQKLISEILSCDVCIPVLHGKKGEDGLIQAFFEAFKVPYVGCDHNAGSICMNKAWTKAICENAKVPIAKFLHLALRDWKSDEKKIIEDIKKGFNPPFYIKGCHMGSTVGMLRCESFSALKKDINEVFAFDDELIVEEEVIGRQIEFALWGNDFIHIGSAAEIMTKGTYTYEEKYEKSLAQIPAEVDANLLDKGKALAIEAYKACSCRGLARVDFFLDRKNKFILNEINPFPGFTKTSPYYPMLKHQGMLASEFINKLIILALHSMRSYV